MGTVLMSSGRFKACVFWALSPASICEISARAEVGFSGRGGRGAASGEAAINRAEIMKIQKHVGLHFFILWPNHCIDMSVSDYDRNQYFDTVIREIYRYKGLTATLARISYAEVTVYFKRADCKCNGFCRRYSHHLSFGHRQPCQ